MSVTASLTEALALVRPEVEDLLIELCRSSSPSHDRQGLQRTAELLASKLAELGLETRLGDDLVLEAGALEAGAGADPPLFVVGHFDTVLAAREPERRGQRMVATGAVDMKGGIAAFLGALGALRRLGVAPPAFLVALVPDEEVGGPSSAEVVRRYGPGAAEMWVLEPGQPGKGGQGGETIVLGRWGLATWELAARGVSAHSGLDLENGRSALAAAARWVDRAQGLGEAERASFNAASFLSPVLSPVSGGAAALNVVPDRAVVRGEIRFEDDDVGEELLGRLRNLGATLTVETGVELAFAMEDRVPAHAARKVDGWLPHLDATAAASGLRLEVERSRRGISFSNFLPAHARPRVLDGLGPVGGGMHTAEEWVSLESLHRRTAWLARLLLGTGGGGS
ncbi:MAG: M20/M25/M40 family metallo-hydrolase [Holophagales bacterium]|nr:M20/M25/M40 family metallo-hydrolase [Holophagales bacterium]